MRYKLILTAVISAAFSMQVYAASSQSYIGGAYGVKQSEDLDGITANSSHSGIAYSIYGGYRFNRVVGIETSYTDYGDISADGHTAFSPTSLSASANLGYSFDNGLRPFALVGLSYVDTNASSEMPLASDSEAGFHLGIGLEYSPIEQMSLRVMSVADSLNVDKVTSKEVKEHTIALNSVQLGVSYNF
ncbi:porin family protein [Vibrio sinaloensis]|uniref:porin family protein n=1 Tax=Photobacterium sp. (strain ATCC 43367) TaxID=379097 RepID=UPI0020465722|nr:porin family protein [Vibrio sinaloensis]UPQ86918.1 porin family protein [Vibrio sinaloensis]